MGQGNITRDKEGDRELEFAVTRVNIFRHSGAIGDVDDLPETAGQAL